MTFSQFAFSPAINEAIDALEFESPTPIQEKVIPLLQTKASVVAQSQTGSGKTHAFMLPLLDCLTPEEKTQLVVTAPSRELAEQLYQVARDIVRHLPFTVHIERAYGGIDTKQQSEKLERVTPQLVIGTPGRLLALVEQQAIDVYSVHDFVVDEADMTLDMGFLGVVDQIASRMPKDLRMAVFSATIPDKLRPFLNKYMDHPTWVRIDQRQLIAPSIENILLPVRGRDRKALLRQIMSVGEPYLMLIFANTIETVEELYTDLKANGFKVGKLHGELSSRERKRVMRQINQLEFQYVVASDLASRGIDIDGVSDVVNYEIPKEIEFFIHRVGRTGRNRLPGRAITLYHPDERPAIDWLMERGITFSVKDIRDGRWVDQPALDERKARKQALQKDPIVNGMIQRTKKQKVKPGYKKKLERNIKQYHQQKARQKQRQKRREERRQKKSR
ncbi:MAG: DEAD/DEAH box helicase [Aerococcus sp.]|nr:DEAD/DEAH box helicase [Aerococcus sp.]